MGNMLYASIGHAPQAPEWLKEARKKLKKRMGVWGIPCAATFFTLLGVHNTTHGLKGSAHYKNPDDPYSFISVVFGIVTVVIGLGLTEYYLGKHTQHPLRNWRARLALALLHVTAMATPSFLFTALIVPEKQAWIPLTTIGVISMYHAIVCIRNIPPLIPEENEPEAMELGIIDPPPVVDPVYPQTAALAITTLANRINQNPPPVYPGGSPIYTNIALILSLALISNTTILDIIRNQLNNPEDNFEDAQEVP